MEKQILDRNDEVSQNYAAAAAYLLRAVQAPQARLRYANRLVELYLSPGDASDTRRAKAVDALLALAKISPEHLSSLETVLFPLAFVARHDQDEYVSKAAEQAWETRGGSLSLAAAKYLKEIVDLATKCLDSPQWALRHAGAKAVGVAADAVVKAKELNGRVNAESLKTLWPVYEKALALKTFDGKEELLKPLEGWAAAVCSASSSDASGEAGAGVLGIDLWSGPSAPLLKKIVLREAKRNNDTYRPHAFACLWKVVAAREEWDMLEEIGEVAGPWLNNFLTEAGDDADKMDVDQPAGRKKGGNTGNELDLRTRTAWAAIEAIVKGYNRRRMRQSPLAVLKEVVLALESGAADKEIKALSDSLVKSPCIARPELEVVRRVFWYECVKDVMEDAVSGPEGHGEQVGSQEKQKVLDWFVHTLDLGVDGSAGGSNGMISGTEPQRLSRVMAVKSLIQLANSGRGPGKTEEASGWNKTVRSVVERALETERSLDVLKVWRSCLEQLS
jgi:proteasome component ECM29